MKACHDFKQMLVESNTSGAFQPLGFEFDTGTESYQLLFNEEKPRQRAGFREMSSIDFSLDQLLTRWRAPKLKYRVFGKRQHLDPGLK
jgi:hypothetical protein